MKWEHTFYANIVAEVVISMKQTPPSTCQQQDLDKQQGLLCGSIMAAPSTQWNLDRIVTQVSLLFI